MAETAPQNGWAMGTCPTAPFPKNVETLPLVSSTNWSGNTKWVGAKAAFSEPTALAEMMVETPRDFRAHILALWGISPGRIRCFLP